LGITGNSGAGKSAVSGICAELGAYVLNADTINHDNMTAGRPAYYEICETFGTEILDEDQAVDRRRLGGKVFADKALLARLVDITHKHVVAEILRRTAQVAASPGEYGFVVIDAPLLVEAGLHTHCDEVWLVTADDETRRSRIRARDNIGDDQITNRFASATPEHELKRYAHEVIDNNYSGIKELRNHISKLIAKRGIL